MNLKLIINWFLIILCSFIISANICYNLITIISLNKLDWNFNFIYTFSKLSDISLLYGTILFYIIVMLVIIRQTYHYKLKLLRKKELPKEDGSFEYGSSRFATEEEIKKKFKVWNVGHKLATGGVPVTILNNKIYYDDSSDHTLIVGTTGSGKSVGLIMPLIFNLADAEESMIINDTKGELYSMTANYLKDKGYNIRIINLRDALSSDGWNPLHLPYIYFKNNMKDEAGDMIENFTKALCKNLSSKDMYWEKSANAVLTALCYALIEDAPKEEQVNLFSIYNLLVEHGSKNIDRFNSLDLYFQQKPVGSLSKMSYATGSFAKGETRATLFSVIATVIKMFSDTGIANLTSRTDFELDSIGREKSAVFLIIPDEKESRHELATLFIDQCYQALVNTAQSTENGTLPVRVNFILDEFANMPVMNMASPITVSRGRHIRYYLVVQDFSMLKEKYKEVASIIKSNTNNWIYLLTADNDTAKEISTRLGKYTTSSSRVSVSSRISSIDDNISNDKSLLGRELLMPEELIRFQFGEGLFLKTRMFPVKTYLKPIQEYNIKIKKAIIPKKEIVYVPECFDLNKFRERKVIEEMDNRVELQ